MVIETLPLTAPVVSGRRLKALPSVTAVVIDALLIAFAVGLGRQGRLHLPWFKDASDVEALTNVAVLPIAVGWILGLIIAGAYAPHAFGAGTTEYKRVLRATLATAGVAGMFCYLVQFPLSRGFFFLTFIAGTPLLVLGRHLQRRFFHVLHRRGRLGQRVLLAGSPEQIDEIAAVLTRERWLGYHVVGAVTAESEPLTRETDRGIRLLGHTPHLQRLVAQNRIDVVLFVGGAVNSALEMRRAAWALEASGATIMLVPSLTDVASDRIRVRPAAGLPLMELEGPRARFASHLAKRCFDVVGAGLLLLAAAPFALAAALWIKLHDRGPVLYQQVRVGRDGRLFSCLKFRSMVVDADKALEKIKSLNKHEDGHVLFKAANDPRITKPGRWIRRLSIDELPQLFNVLRGDMSLVGPRPPLPREVALYSSDAHRRLSVRPGLTGLWQVSGRSDLSWEDSVRLDLYYVDNFSIVQDLVILARTAQAVLSSRGAY